MSTTDLERRIKALEAIVRHQSETLETQNKTIARLDSAVRTLDGALSTLVRQQGDAR